MDFAFDTCINEKIIHNINGQILKTNVKFKETFGDGICLEKFITDLLLDFQYKIFLENLTTSNNTIFSQKSFLSQKGEQIFEIYVIPYHDNFIVTLNNITEIRDLQKLFFTSQKHSSIGIMASGLSHDFKNTLQNIKIYLALIQQSDDKSEAKKYMNIVDRLISDSHSYINNLLQTSANGNDEKKSYFVDELLKPTINILEKIIGLNIAITYLNMIPDAKIQVSFSIFKQIIINICMNAFEAISGKADGVIGILVESIDKEGENFIKISITDNGSGINSEDLKNVFNPFFTTKKSKGTGLGLTMVKMAIKDMRGVVHVESEEGAWTSVSIYLPAQTF